MASKKRNGGTTPPIPTAETYTLSELEQVKVLADPLRIRLLEAFMEERTTKQAADLLGEKPTRLYHHVEALERVGLLRQTRTRPNRGTVEKYYVAIARTFRAEASLFSAEATPEGSQAMQGVIDTLFGNTAAELRRLIADGGGALLEQEGLLSFVEIQASEKKIEAFQKQLEKMLADIAEESDDLPESESRRYRLTLAYFPLDRPEVSEPPSK